MDKALTVEAVRTKYHQLHPLMTQRFRRLRVCCEAESLGRGGPSIVAQATRLVPDHNPVWSWRTQATARTSPGDDLEPPNEFGPRAADEHLVEQKDSAILTVL